MKITQLPKEILSLIFADLQCRDLAAQALVCSRFLILSRDDLLWSHLLIRNYPNAAKEIRVLIKQVNASKKLKILLKPDGVYQLYKSIFPAAPLFGFWHMDYSFFHGGLLHVRLDGLKGVTVDESLNNNHLNELEVDAPLNNLHLDDKIVGPALNIAPFNDMMVVGELILPNDRPEANAIRPFSLNHSVAVDTPTNNGFRRKPIFEMNLGNDDSFLVCTHENATNAASSGLHKTHAVKTQWINVKDKIEAEHVPYNLSALDMSERIRANSFPLGHPCSMTGLWPYPSPNFASDETLYRRSINNESTWEQRVFSISCASNCHQKRIRSLVINAQGIPAPQSLTYTPLFSSIQIPPTSSELAIDVQSFWVGTYGTHGSEIVQFRFADDPSGISIRPCIICNKITGDVNVPRGEMTFWLYIDIPRSSDGFDFAQSDEFRGCSVYKGKGRVAMV